MSRRFPRNVKVTVTPREMNGLAGHQYEATLDGVPVSYGWAAGAKSAAREQAWNALEQQGLVTDGVES